MQKHICKDTVNNKDITFSSWPRLKAVRNALRTGHCAPTVMRTLRELQGADSEPMVKLVSAMAGGIGLLRNECGAASSPILLLGLIYGEDTGRDGIPKVISLGQKYFKRFAEIHGGVRCREVTPTFQNVFPCMQVMRRAPKLLIDIITEDRKQDPAAIHGETAGACAELLTLFRQQKFHCAHSVLFELQDRIDLNDEQLRATWGLLGGTVLQGMTCGALAAGVLAIGLKYGKIENSYLRVPRLLFRIAAGLEFMHEDYNAFNKSMNIGNRLGLWFKEEFNGTECKEILHKDLSTPEGIKKYISDKDVDMCRGICARVASKVQEIFGEFPG
jgi:C_GCAxxG_C_C family probable redox protein